MSRILRTAAPFAVLAVLVAADLHAGPPAGIVRVYDASAVPPDVRAAALSLAASILGTAGSTMDWRDCTKRSTELDCQRTDPTRDLIVRIMPTWVKPIARGGALAALERTGHAREQPLGLAVIHPDKNMSRTATIFDESVHRMARRASVERSVLLGRTLAHEVGHLLLRVPVHSRSGLMRAVWTDAELIANRFEDWLFSPADQESLQRNMRLVTAERDAWQLALDSLR